MRAALERYASSMTNWQTSHSISKNDALTLVELLEISHGEENIKWDFYFKNFIRNVDKLCTLNNEDDHFTRIKNYIKMKSDLSYHNFTFLTEPCDEILKQCQNNDIDSDYKEKVIALIKRLDK